MKNTLLIAAGLIAVPFAMVIAKDIDFDTSIEWNSGVVEEALNQTGFSGNDDAVWDVRVTHDRILADLLKRNSFSLRDATSVCMDKCNMSDFLKNGRGASGKKCPDLCKTFAEKLVSVNNFFKDTGNIPYGSDGLVEEMPDGTIKVWSADKKYYVYVFMNKKQVKKYANICINKEDYGYDYLDDRYQRNPSNPDFAVVFDAKNNKPIGLYHMPSEDGAIWINKYCHIAGYETFDFDVDFNSSISSDGMPTELFVSDKRDYCLSLYEKYAPEVEKFESELNRVKSMEVKVFTPYFTESFYNAFTDIVRESQEKLSEYQQKLNSMKSGNCKYFLIRASEDIKSLKWLESSVRDYNLCFTELKSKNGQIYDWTDIQTKTPAEAYRKATSDLVGWGCQNYVDESQIKCSGICNPIPGTDDTVTCQFHDITVKYIFDDICD